MSNTTDDLTRNKLLGEEAKHRPRDNQKQTPKPVGPPNVTIKDPSSLVYPAFVFSLAVALIVFLLISLTVAVSPDNPPRSEKTWATTVVKPVKETGPKYTPLKYKKAYDGILYSVDAPRYCFSEENPFKNSCEEYSKVELTAGEYVDLDRTITLYCPQMREAAKRTMKQNENMIYKNEYRVLYAACMAILKVENDKREIEKKKQAKQELMEARELFE